MTPGSSPARRFVVRDGRSCSIRHQRDADASGVAALAGRSAVEESAAEAVVRQEGGLGLVATDDEECIVAHLVVGRRPADQDCGEVALFVDPAWRRGGVGTALIGAALEWAASESLNQLFVRVEVDNEPALALYRRQGFEAPGAAEGGVLLLSRSV